MRVSPAQGKILDIGCGCGILGLLMATEFRDLRLTALDIQQINCDITAKNSSLNGISSEVICADFRGFKMDKKADFIISNPPFYTSGSASSKNEHISISKDSEHLSLDDFISGIKCNLKPNGVAFIAYDARRLNELLASLEQNTLRAVKLKLMHPNAKKPAKLALLELKPAAKSPLIIEPPLYNFSSDADFSAEAKEIFAKTHNEILEWQDDM